MYISQNLCELLEYSMTIPKCLVDIHVHVSMEWRED